MTVRRPWALPLTGLYGSGLAVKNLAYARGWLRSRSLARPVISVGSLSAGGAGKTPVVIALAGLCRRRGARVDVLSRGYGRTSSAIEEVAQDWFASAAHYGDEPVEMMRAGLHVYVGADRFAAGLLAERTHAAAAHLLDDGFQHRKLMRELDLVLLTGADVEDCLLPAGNLREPLSALRRADVVLLREEEAEPLRDVVQARSKAEVWIIRRELVFQEQFARPFCFCGIARPESFLGMIRDAGYTPAETMVFPDHYAYTSADIERLVASARAANADGFYLTEKDAVKLPKAWIQHLQTLGPVHAPFLRVSFVDEVRVFDKVQEVLGR